MSDDANLIDGAVGKALDAFVYAPIGLLFDGPEVFPQLVEKGRSHVAAARMIGEFTVNTGQNELRKRFEQGSEQLLDLLGGLGLAPDGRTEPREPARPTRAATETVDPVDAPPPTPPPDLAIPDYDTLSASQVVKRLAGLAPDELEAVRAHESANRGRKTILNKVAQLQK